MRHFNMLRNLRDLVLYVKTELQFVIAVYHLTFNVNETLNDFIYFGDYKRAMQMTSKISNWHLIIIGIPRYHTK